jgi:hypothetical protein
MKKNMFLKKYISFPGRQYDYCIISNCLELYELLKLIYGNFLVEMSIRKSIEIIVIKKSERLYQCSFAGKTSIEKNPIHFISNVFFENPYFDKDILPLHGAAISNGRWAYIFLGSSGAGKTTLTAYLLSNGFRYISEDCILINFEKNLIVPCPTPLHVREGGKEILTKNNIYINYNIATHNSFDRYVYIPPFIEIASLPIKAIFFILRTDGKEKLYLIEKEEAFIKLIKASFIMHPLKHPYVQAFKRLSSIPCYQLEYSDFSFVKKALLSDNNTFNQKGVFL